MSFVPLLISPKHACRNRVHLTPMPNQQEKHERPTPMVSQVPTEDKVATPVRKDAPVTKGDIQIPPVTPILGTRPKRIIRPSLKVRENLGLA